MVRSVCHQALLTLTGEEQSSRFKGDGEGPAAGVRGQPRIWARPQLRPNPWCMHICECDGELCIHVHMQTHTDGGFGG